MKLLLRLAGLVFLVILLNCRIGLTAPELAGANRNYGSSSTSTTTIERCQAHVESPLCQKFQGRPGALKVDQCKFDVAGDNWSLHSRLSNCANGLVLSAKDLLSFLFEGIKFLGKSSGAAASGLYNFVTNGDSRSATRESIREAWDTAEDYLNSMNTYIIIEYQKAYAQVGAPWNLNESSRTLKAAMNMHGQLIGALANTAKEYLITQYKEFECFENNKQVEMICRMLPDILLPPKAFFSLLKHGPKGLKQMKSLTRKLDDVFRPESVLLNENGSIKEATKKGGIADRIVRAATNAKSKHAIETVVDDSRFKNLETADGYSVVKNDRSWNYLRKSTLDSQPGYFFNTLVHETRHGVNSNKVYAPKNAADFKNGASKRIRFFSDSKKIGIKGYDGYMRADESEAYYISSIVGKQQNEKAYSKMKAEKSKQMNLRQQEFLKQARDQVQQGTYSVLYKDSVQATNKTEIKYARVRVDFKDGTDPFYLDMEVPFLSEDLYQKDILELINYRLKQLEGHSLIRGK